MVKIPAKAIEVIETEKLLPYVNNSRTHSKEQIDQIAASIKEFGFVDSILIDKDNTIIAGHGRLQAARKLGLEEVPCVRIEHLTKTQQKALVIAHNKIATNAGWDDEVLSLELKDIHSDGFDTDIIGFDEKEMSDLLADDPTDGLTDDDEIPETPEHTTIKEGNIYQLGRHKMICGDATDPEILLKLFGEQKADLYLTDPPYNVDYVGSTKDKLTILNDKQDDDQFTKFLTDSFTSAEAVIKQGGSFYIFHADTNGLAFRKAVKDALFELKQNLIWVKNTMVMGRQDYHWQHEPCLYGWKKGSSHSWYSDRKQTTTLMFDKPSKNAEHPTMKPVKLVQYLISNSTKQEDIVLDNFLGSGTTLIACEKLNRCCYGVELDPKYCDVIIKRWQDFTGKEAKLIN